MSAFGLEPNLEIIDELNPSDDDIWHTVCCKDEHVQLCGGVAPYGITGTAGPDNLECLTCRDHDIRDICPKFAECIDPEHYDERFDN